MTTGGAAPESPQETGLLLLPGMDGTSLLFEPFMEVASERRPVTAVQYPKDASGRTYAALEPFVLDRLPTTRPYVIVAESFSGPLALRIAAKRPPGLRGLVLCATFVKPPRPLLTWFARWPGAAVAMRAAGRFGGPFVRNALIGRDAPPALRVRAGWVLAHCVDPECLAARAGEISRVDAEQDLVSAACPILCIRGLRDRVVPASAARRMAELRPSITMAEVDAPHAVLQTRPRECLDLIEAFIGSLPPPVPTEPGAAASPVKTPPAEAMIQLDLAMASALFALGHLPSGEPLRLADALLAAGRDEQSIIDLFVTDHSRPERVAPLFERMCADLGFPVGERAGAEMRLIRARLRSFVDPPMSPWRMRSSFGEIRPLLPDAEPGHYAGETWGIEELIGLVYRYDDLMERPSEVSFDWLLGDGAIERWTTAMRAAAAAWLDAHPPGDGVSR